MTAPDSIPFEQAVTGGVVNMVPHDPPRPELPDPAKQVAELTEDVEGATLLLAKKERALLRMKGELRRANETIQGYIRRSHEPDPCQERQEEEIRNLRRTVDELTTDGNAVTLADALQRKCAELDEARKRPGRDRMERVQILMALDVDTNSRVHLPDAVTEMRREYEREIAKHRWVARSFARRLRALRKKIKP